MGLFSSSWKYYAFAASTPLFESDEHPETFRKVMLEALPADDTFGNILRYTLATDMYARAKSMTRYATREVDPYIRGLPTSDLTTFNIQKSWINSAILREIKMPLLDFFWMKHGIFDAHYVGCKFIHDNYMDIDYFPWPGGCLPGIKNPNFDNELEHWIPTDFQHNATERVAELTSNGGTLFSDQVGQVTPGEIISLRAVCCRGSDDPGQTGSINITFYNSSGTEVSTATAENTTTSAEEWELLTVIATVPAGAVTAKAWAGGTMGTNIRRIMEAIETEGVASTVSAYGQFWPWQSHWPDTGWDSDLDFGYTGGLSYDWDFGIRYIESPGMTDADQVYWKVTIDNTISGTLPANFQAYNHVYHGDGGDLDTWHDPWPGEYEIFTLHKIRNGVMQRYEATLSIAKGNGTGGPDLNTVVEYPFEFRTYNGKRETTIYEGFTANTGDLINRSCDLDRRRDGGARTDQWHDVHYDRLSLDGDSENDWDYGYVGVSSSGYARSYTGVVTNEALYAIDAEISDFRIESEMEWGGDNFSSSVYAGGGVAFRVQDWQNFWLFAIKNPESSDPILGLYKVVDNVHTLVAGLSLATPHGAMSDNSAWETRLTCHGDTIRGEIAFNDGGSGYGIHDQGAYILEVSDSTFKTATKAGLWALESGMIWQNWRIYPWPLGAINWDIFVWDSTAINTTESDTDYAWNMFYVYEGSNTKTDHPYDSSFSVENGNGGVWGSVVNWRLTPFGEDTILAQVEAVSGDTGQLLLWEYGQAANTFSFGEWVDAFRLLIALERDIDVSGVGTFSATFRVRFCIDNGSGDFGSRSPVAGTESVWKNITLNTTVTG